MIKMLKKFFLHLEYMGKKKLMDKKKLMVNLYLVG